MRTHSAQDDAVFSAQGQTTFFRAFVKDASGVFRDLTTLGSAGWNFLEGIEIKESADDVAASCTLSVKREIFKLSLAADIAASELNTLGGVAQAVDGKFRLLEGNAEVYVEAQIQPLGTKAPVAGSWKEIFRGRIEKVNTGQDPCTVECRDYMSRLQTRWIKTERAYGVWQPSRRAPTGYVVVPTVDNPASPSAYWQWTSATGTTGATEPTWPGSPTPGVTTIADNGGTWTCIAAASGGTPMETLLQLLLDDNTTPGTYSLYTPSSPTFLMRDYNQRKEPLQSALQTIANCVAWDIRYRWDDGLSAFRLTLLNPNRANVTSQYVIPASKYEEIKDYPRDISGVRNVIEVAFLDVLNLDANGNPVPSLVQRSDANSVATFDEQFMGVAEGASAPVATSAQATAMADAILSDLAQPLVEVPIAFEFSWWFQLHDMVTLKKDGIHTDADQVMAISTITHTLRSGESGRTELGLRAKPSSGHWKWHREASGAPGLNGGAARTLGPRRPSTAVAAAAFRGGVLTWRIPQSQKERYAATEVYLSTVNNFTPGLANRIHTGPGDRLDVTGLVAGTTYYAKLRHLDARGNPGDYTAQLSFVADQIQTADVAPGAITPAKLSAFQRSGFLYKLAADSGVINSYAAITFGTLVYDALAQRSGANFIPNQTGTWEWTVRLRLEGGDILPGYGISVAILNVTAGTVLYTSPPKMVFSDPAPAGDAAPGSSVDACIAELDWSIPVTAGNSYAIAFVFVKDIHFNTSLASWGAVLGQAIAKADYVNPHVASVQIAGSYVRVRPVIQ